MKTFLERCLISGLAALAAIACQRDPRDGLQAASSEKVVATTGYPAVVEVVLPNGAGFCSGTFIGPRAVLTAAHCTKVSGEYRVVSSFGSYLTSTYEAFGTGALDDANDISILILDSEVATTREAQIVPIGASVAVLDEVRLVGFGCDDVQSMTGMGQKRTGTNQIAAIDDFLELDTPSDSADSGNTGILGPINRAGSCFGDSGGPLLRSNGSYLQIVGVTHAGGLSGSDEISQYVDLTRADNQQFLHNIDAQYGLHLFETCAPDGVNCNYETASTQIFASVLVLWHKLVAMVLTWWHGLPWK